MRAPRFVLCAVLTLLSLPQTSHGVSYFGDSYCRIDVAQDLLSFHLSLQFKTSKRSGLLLLAAGNIDYLSVELINGRLQARMDLGSGEVVLSSSPGVQLNNLLDHRVSLTLQENKLLMSVDEIFTTSADVQGEEEYLSIDRGVFLGGVRDLDVEYISTAVPFLRGCMDGVNFESHQFSILSSAAMVCHDTIDICSGEFEAADGEAISFTSSDSFVSFPTWTRPNTGSRDLEILMKTTIEDALLLFHPGQESDFIALGMAGGYLKGVAQLGNGMVILNNAKVKLDDDQWHRIRMFVDTNTFEITVDSESVTKPLYGSEKLDLVGNLYLGGIQGKMKDVFRDSYLTFMEDEITPESFIGCLGDIKINQKVRTLQDALITKDLHNKCEGEEYDYSTDYYETTATTAPTQITILNIQEERHCVLSEDMPEIFANVSKLLEVTPLLVPEGGEAFIEISNLNPTFDLNAAGIRQSQIIFTLQTSPLYGILDMNINTRRTKKFTLLDVANKKIKYLHDGNEKSSDQIQLEVAAHGFNLPECLKNPHQYRLPVEILPVNDVPQLSGEDITITANGHTRLSPNLVKIADSDKRCDNLIVTIISDTSSDGYLENSERPNWRLRNFTCRQLKDGLIYYVHQGGSENGLTLKVSDGSPTSQPVTFKLVVTEPQIRVVTNTGLRVVQGANSSIGIQNLAVSASPQNGDIIFNVTQPLRFGELQIIGRDGVPQRVSQFYQSDLEENRLMYTTEMSSDLDGAETEYIHFNVQWGQFTLPDNTFIIQIMPAQVIMAKIFPLNIASGVAKVIKTFELEARVKGKNIDPAFIRYIVLRRPTLGALMFHNRDLSDRDSFTQQDIDAGYISYRPTIHRASDENDFFQFNIFADDQFSQLFTYPISIQSDSGFPELTNELLLVLKGNESTLSKEHLWVQTQQSTNFVYRIIQDPLHGRLIRDSPPGVPRFEGAVRVFSNEDILLNRLIYKHDGSEFSQDQFTFQVRDVSTGSTEEHNVTEGTFHITIQFRNNYVPQRVINKPFYVTRNGQRLLTTDDILFRDEDSGFNDTQLVYSREGILSGNIVSSANPLQPLYRFTQADLREKNILFVHHGADRDLFQLHVSDGLHRTTALLEVQASDPFLRIVNNTMVVMDYASTRTLDTSVLGTETNMDIRSASEMMYEINTPPSDGKIIVSGIEATRFTQEDLRKGVVSYENSDQSLRSTDSFGFTVRAKNMSVEGSFRIKIVKQGFLSKPQVSSNKVIISYEGEHSVIDQDHLRVEQANISPAELVFTLKELPRFGHLVKLINDTESTVSPVLDYIQSFTQEDINMGTILYLSSSEHVQDTFTLNVSNGFTTIEDLEVQVDVIPRYIPVQAANLTVREGDHVILSEDIVNVTHTFYRENHVEFILVEAPQHGEIRYVDKEDDALVSFTWDDVQQGSVYYFHDGTEAAEDSFTFTATAFELNRRSVPISVGVTVIPVNDEPPQLKHNTGLELLVGEEMEITSKSLSVEDLDTPSDKLVYNIEGTKNGIVALKVFPDTIIERFTQEQIDNGEVIFIHKGSESGRFSFTVTDGDHTSPLYRFVVAVRQLTISMEVSGELLVFPGSRKAITSDILRAVTSEDGDEISYTLVKPPRLGRLIKPNQSGQFEEITLFTQTELDAGAVYYEHQMPSESFWVVKDSVELELSSPPAAKLKHILSVIVSYYATNQNVTSQLWKNKGMSVVQGQSKVFNISILDASNLLGSVPQEKRAGQDIVFEVRQFPKHGHLTLGGEVLPRNTPYFLQDDISKGKLEYHHDDSGALSDRLSLSVRLNPRGRPPQAVPGATVLEEVFLISVRRRDSSPPELVTLDLLLEALQGSTTVLSKQHLNTVDQDSTPDEVKFTIMTSPANGHIIYMDTGDKITEFTQEEVNMGKVAFVSDGSVSEGYMEFTMSDGKHQSDTHMMHIGILAKKLLLNKVHEIQVKQGDDETPITEAMLKATTGGPIEEEVIYKITNNPKYAVVMVDREATSAFTQKQIREGRVSVRFIKSTSSNDSFSFVARSRAANVSSSLNITVKPLVNVAKVPLLPRGTRVLVDRKLLDATLLANKTKTSPTFSVTQQPKGARFIKRGGPSDGQPVGFFTQKDLDEGQVALEVLNATGDPKAKGQDQDEARFLLKAHGVPPAECTLAFQTAPYDPAGIYGATVLEVPSSVPNSDTSKADQPAGGADGTWLGAGPTTSSPSSHRSPVLRRNSIWAILIPILVILLLLIVAGVLAYYLVRRNKTGKHNVQNAATKPKNGEVAQETFRKTDPANSIPMSNMESKDPELLQHCRTTNPALKKNQYWV